MKNVPQWIKKELYKYKTSLIGVLFLLLFNAFCLALIPNLISKIIDVAIPYKDPIILFESILICLILYVTLHVSSFILEMIFVKIGSDFSFTLKQNIFDDIYKIKGEKLSIVQGKLLPIFINDIPIIEQFFVRNLPKVVSSIVFTVVISTVLLVYNVKLTIILFILIGMSILFQLHFNKNIKQESKLYLEKFDESTGYLEVVFTNLLNSIGHNSSEFFSGHFKLREGAVQEQRKKVGTIYVFSGSIPSFINSMSTVLVLGFGAIGVMYGDITLGILTVFLYYSGRMLYPILSILSFTRDWKRVQNSLNRIDEVKLGVQVKDDTKI